MKGEIINWKFKEFDSGRSIFNYDVRILKMGITFETCEGEFDTPVFANPENEEMIDLVDKELRLNLKLQYGILR